jgi:hypothetical protein
MMRTDQITYSSYCNLLPSSALCLSLCNLFKGTYPSNKLSLGTIPKLFSIFQNNIYNYKRVDLNSTAIPALTIYPTQGKILGESWYMRSSINMDFIYPGGAMIRARSTEIATVISEAVIFTILKNDNILEYLKFGLPDSNGNPTWGPFPGLRDLGEQVEAEFTEVNSLVKDQDSVMMRLRVSYTIDTVQWWQYIQEFLGNDVFDPCVFLYPLIAGYQVEVNLQSALTPVPPYPTN